MPLKPYTFRHQLPKVEWRSLPMDPFTDVLVVDIETASLVDLKRVGAWVYSRHPSTRPYCVSFGSSDTDYLETWEPGNPIPERVVDFVRAGGQIVAHNVSFERAIWLNILVPRYDFPPVEPEQWRCTQAMGLALNLPATLEGLAKALGCPIQKDTEGAALMRKMASAVEGPRGGAYSYPMGTRANLDRLSTYCEGDVGATRLGYRAMRRNPALPLQEERLWLVDQEINARGVFLDRPFARRCQEIARERQAQLHDEVFGLTAGALCSAADPAAMKKWVRECGVKLPKLARAGGPPTETLNAHAVQGLLEADLPPVVRAVLLLRQEASSATSLAKLNRVADMTDADGRLRNGLQFHGAHTGRWTSYGLQLHNLPKVKLSAVDLALARSVIEHGDLELMTMLFERPLQVLKQLLRSIVSAPPGHELIAGDFSAIEARVVAWLSGQDDILELFRNGADVYTYAAKNVGSDDRQLGKVATLMLGFGAGPVKTEGTAATMGVLLSLKEWKHVVAAWREKNARIVKYWFELEEAAHRAVNSPGRTFTAGRIQARCTAGRQCLLLQLPSGRTLRYWRPSLVRATKIVKTVNDEGEIVEMEFTGTELRFFTPGKDKTTMYRDASYGGKLVENVTQAVARDLLGDAILRLHKFGWPYEIVIHVHDSVASEVPVDQGDVEEFCWIMGKAPAWADGLPIAVDGYRDTRFRG